MFDLILKNCKIVNENSIFESDIAIKNSRIELISKEISADSKQVVDVQGRYVIPGLIDDQVHFREPGLLIKVKLLQNQKLDLLEELQVILRCQTSILQQLQMRT